MERPTGERPARIMLAVLVLCVLGCAERAPLTAKKIAETPRSAQSGAAATDTGPSLESVAAEMIAKDLTQDAPKSPVRIHVDSVSVKNPKLLLTCLERSLGKAGFQVVGTTSQEIGKRMSLDVGDLTGTTKSLSVKIGVVWAPKAGYIVRLVGNAKSYKVDLLAQAKHA
jgi:hypothetical protein